jgi:hypothetical protein
VLAQREIQFGPAGTEHPDTATPLR